MRKIFLLLLIFLLIASVSASNNLTVEVNGVDFQIPQRYSGGTFKKGEYVYKDLNTFGILCVDNYIITNYGYWARSSDISQDLSIDNRPIKFLSSYNSYSDTNVSHVYFPIGESVYLICFEGNNLTSEISNIIENAPQSDIDSDTFNGLLDEAQNQYNQRRYIDQSSEDYYQYAHGLNDNGQHNNFGVDETFIKWYLLTRLSRR